MCCKRCPSFGFLKAPLLKLDTHTQAKPQSLEALKCLAAAAAAVKCRLRLLCMHAAVCWPSGRETNGGVLHTLSPLSPGLLTQQIQFISNFVTDKGQILLSAFENWKNSHKGKKTRPFQNLIWLLPCLHIAKGDLKLFWRQLSTDGACRGDLCHAAGIKLLNLFSSGIWRHLLLHILTQCACACNKIIYVGEHTRLTKKYSINKP